MNEQQIFWAFSTLGLPRNATKEQAKHAYRLLCKQYHPDKSNSDSTIQMYLLVQQAYEIVCYVLDFQQNSQYQKTPTAYNMPGYNTSYVYQQSPHWNYQTPSGGKILGNNESVRRNYNQMQQRKAETKRLHQWESTTKRKKEQEKKQMVQELLGSRKLPSQYEQEKWEELEKKKEAERIAGIIQKILETKGDIL